LLKTTTKVTCKYCAKPLVKNFFGIYELVCSLYISEESQYEPHLIFSQNLIQQLLTKYFKVATLSWSIEKETCSFVFENSLHKLISKNIKILDIGERDLTSSGNYEMIRGAKFIIKINDYLGYVITIVTPNCHN